MTADQRSTPSLAIAQFAVLFAGWVCGTCGGGGVASDGTTCPDCNGHGHT
jgi:DnaJ-class molecular chaperone